TWRTFDVSEPREEANASAVVDAAFSAGTRFFGSSPMYGEAERALALSLASRRSQAIVATKIWTPDDAAAERQITRALKWFGVIDLYQIHNLVSWRSRLARL